MATGVISKKYLIDIANAIRIMLDTETTYTPSQMASAIALITGNASGGELVKSSNTDVGLITDTLMDGICDSLRTALDSEDTYTPSQIADAIMTISSGSVDIVPWSTGTDEQIVAMLQAAHNGDIDLQTDGGWAVGDVRTIHINAISNQPSQDMDIIITGFGSSGYLLQFDSLNCLEAKIEEPRDSNGLNKQNCKNLLSVLPEAFPSWLKGSLIVLEESRKLGLIPWSQLTSGYYDSNSKRIKKLGRNGEAANYFLNDAYGGGSYYIYYVSTSGEKAYQSLKSTKAVAFYGRI